MKDNMAGRRYYEKGALLPIEEDEYHEFKGHRSISIEELPPWCFQPNSNRRTRKPASRTLCGFLNSGRGGILYLGIIDSGVPKGFFLTEYQKDHILVSIKDMFSRYNPPVEENMYEIEFVPIIKNSGIDSNHEAQSGNGIKTPCMEKHLKAHLLRTFDYCWCDQDLSHRIRKGFSPAKYVVEVKVLPQKSSFKVFDDGTFRASLSIVHQNEEGKCFFRKSASCVEYSIEETKELALLQLRDLYEPVLSSMRDELKFLMDEVAIFSKQLKSEKSNEFYTPENDFK